MKVKNKYEIESRKQLGITKIYISEEKKAREKSVEEKPQR